MQKNYRCKLWLGRVVVSYFCMIFVLGESWVGEAPSSEGRCYLSFILGSDPKGWQYLLLFFLVCFLPNIRFKTDGHHCQVVDLD